MTLLEGNTLLDFVKVLISEVGKEDYGVQV